MKFVVALLVVLLIFSLGYSDDLTKERNAWALRAANLGTAYETHLVGEYRKSLCGITKSSGENLSITEGTCLEGARQEARKVVEATTKK